ncbi:MAG: hypothetical protein HIU88_12965 [Acidobacteria bacterium]|nr:hypothetical protein [Acidobacteriota bacterium]
MSTPRRPALLWVLIAMLTVEFLGVGSLAVTLVVETLTTPSATFGAGIALTIVVIVAAVWLAAIVVGTYRGRAWIRAAAIVWQVLQVAVGVGALQGQVAQPGWGWPLIVLAAFVFLVLFAKSVVTATTRRESA